MAGIGDMVAHLGIDNSNFKRGLSQSRSLLSAFTGGVAGLMSPMTAAFAGLAGAGGVGMLVKSSFQSVDALTELGSTFGKSAAEMAGWQHAAKLSSLSMDQLIAGIHKLQKENVNIFELADRVASISDPAARAALAMQYLGESGGKFLPLLQGGSAAIREMVQEGSQLSGLEGLDVSKIEAANDALTRSQAAIAGVGNMLAIELAPWIESAAVEMQSLGSVAAFMFANMGDYAELAWTRVKLGAVTVWESIWHLFTQQVPAALSWFGQNWNNVWNDLLNRTDLFITNLGTNIAAGMQEIWDYITSGGTDKIEMAWVPLQKGFISTIEKLPDIPPRALSELEKELGGQVEAIGEDLSSRLAEKLYGGVGSIAPNMAGAGLGSEGVASGVASGKFRGSNKVALMGSQEAASILLRGVGGPGTKNIEENQLQTQKQMLAALNSIKGKPVAQLQPLTI